MSAPEYFYPPVYQNPFLNPSEDLLATIRHQQEEIDSLKANLQEVQKSVVDLTRNSAQDREILRVSILQSCMNRLNDIINNSRKAEVDAKNAKKAEPSNLRSFVLLVITIIAISAMIVFILAATGSLPGINTAVVGALGFTEASALLATVCGTIVLISFCFPCNRAKKETPKEDAAESVR